MEKQNLVISMLHLDSVRKGAQDLAESVVVGEKFTYKGEVFTKVANDCVEVVPMEYTANYEDYEFTDIQKVGSYTRTFEITAKDVETIIVNSFEGGSTYWLGLETDNEQSIWGKKPKGLPYSTWATQMLLEGKTLHFYDVEDEEEKFTLNLEQLVNGIKLNSENRPHDSNIEDGDSATADCIVQYAIFGEIVYS